MFIKYKKTVQYINRIQGQGKGINDPGIIGDVSCCLENLCIRI
jgi:hypothetical protein